MAINTVQAALEKFIATVEATGGIEYDEQQRPYPVGDPEWLDLADAYLAAKAALTAAPVETPASPAQIKAARETYGSDEVEIDDNAHLSVADDGVWVSAWVWLYNRDIVEHKPGCATLRPNATQGECDCGAIDSEAE